MKLNSSQVKAEKEIVRFLMGNSGMSHLILDAPSGYGKTHLINHITQNISKYRDRADVLGTSFPYTLDFAAPTNKAASLGFSGQTVHKALKLRPYNDFKTGKSYLEQATPIKINSLVVDEYSMVNTELLKFINKSVDKTIWIGDGYQLPPIGEHESPVKALNAIRVVLTIPERQHPDSPLFQTCLHFRKMVELKKMIKTSLNSDVLHISGKTMDAMMSTHFGTGQNNRIVTFTNNKAIRINAFIRKKHGHDGYWKEGESVVAKNFAFSSAKNVVTSAEEDLVIQEVDETDESIKMKGAWFKVSDKPQQVLNAIKKAKKDKDFQRAFALQEYWLDLRSGYAGTCHSVQGSTYDNIFIDLSDFNVCSDLNVLTRLLYVAVSRAKSKVYFYGKTNFDLF